MLLRALVGPAITLAGLFAVVPVAMNSRLQRFNFFDCAQPTTVLANATEPSFSKPVISPCVHQFCARNVPNSYIGGK